MDISCTPIITETKKIVKVKEKQCDGIALNIPLETALMLFKLISNTNGNSLYKLYTELLQILNQYNYAAKMTTISGARLDVIDCTVIERSEEFKKEIERIKNYYENRTKLQNS